MNLVNLYKQLLFDKIDILYKQENNRLNNIIIINLNNKVKKLSNNQLSWLSDKCGKNLLHNTIKIA